MRKPVAIGLSAAAFACSPTLPPPAVGPSPADARSTEQSQLLLFPQVDAEALLGRAVQRAADGSWTIADARAPGCEVAATRSSAVFHASRQVDAHTMTSFAGSYAKVVAIDARFGRQSSASVEVNNTAIVHGQLRGACGALVIDTVFVGKGRRRITASAEARGRADVHAGFVHASPGVDTGQSKSDDLEWNEEQAYGFSARENAKAEPLQLSVSIPSIVDEGADVEVRFESAAPAWLVVYYIDAAGHADVLWPSNEEPEPQVAPGRPAVLPSAREKTQGFRIKAALLAPGKPSRETLVVYGFVDRRDFMTLKPAAGASNADGPAYAAELTQKLQAIPIDRWSRAVAGYLIQPRK